jgi:hypothetical protein
MLGILKYATLSNYSDATEVGTLRSRKKGFTLKPITDDNRDGNPETIAYEVEVRALCLTLDGSFLSATEYYFQVDFADDSKAANLGLREYQINYDGQINRNGVEYNEVRLFFLIDAADYGTYIPQVIV